METEIEAASANTPAATARPTLLKAVSSPTALSLSLHSAPIVAKPATPPPATLSQIGRQTSVNFRLSQLSDSGAESCDADEQTRLIRTPSSRSHKFIIIPSTPPVGGVAPKFRQTISTTSLTAVASGVQKSPLTTVAAVAATMSSIPTTPQQQEPLGSQTAPHSALNSCSSNDNLPPCTQPAPVLAALSPSDVIHQTNVTAAAALTPPHCATGVTFTIEDYESDAPAGATDATVVVVMATADASSEQESALISSIKSAAKFTPTSTALPTTTITTTLAAPLTSSSAAASTLDISSYPRNSSMRSIASAYTPASLQDPTNDPQYLHPSSSFAGASSYIFHDHVANQIYSDVTSVRSLASIGIGSTDGRKLVIRRVPHTPNELFSLVHPSSSAAPPGIDDDDDDSFLDMSDEAATLKPRQQHWGNKMQFVLACIGYSVGLGNVWRFPYMCYKSGGGVFLVPYCIILFVCSIPLLFMELSIGQYTGRGPIGALGQLCPLFKGAGLASVVVSFLMSTYFSVIIGYSIYYFFTSFKSYMPWIDCNNRWNTPDCFVPQPVNSNITAPNMSRTPSEEFFENKVLQISPGIEYPGAMRWELFVCLICAWLMVYFATWKSIKSSAKVRYFTATFPFILIIILLGRAVTLDGADAGLRYFFRPNWSELKKANVWINAASQNFNSLGITFGSMISFASYNKYNNNIVRDTIAVSVVNIVTSFLVGVFAFATLGNLALEQNTHVGNVIGDGPGLIFVVYPQAMAKMPYAQLWAVMFFFMLLCLGLNSQFAIVEVVVTSIQDGFPNWIKRHLGYHEIVVLFVCVISFLFGLPNLIQGGIYYFQLMDHYAASVSIMFLAFCQMIAIAWFYGTGRLSKNVKQMTGKAPSLYLKSCWILLGPCLLFAIWVLSLINYHEPTYHNGHYKYPEWAYGIGWMFASFSLVCIPGYALINLLRSSGDTFWERVKNTLRPNIYECRICGEHHCEHDYPEQEQYMLTQELSGMYKSSEPSKSNTGYNPMQLQQQRPQQTEFSFEDATTKLQQTKSNVTGTSETTAKR